MTMPPEAEHAVHYTVKARLAHQTARRLRLRLTVPPGPEANAIADALARVEGVARTRVRPNTASVIIDTLVPAETVLQALQEGGLVKLMPPVKKPPVGQVINLGLLQADMAIGKRTGGALDLKTSIGLLLALGAMIQLARGKVAGPALTMALSAYSLLAAARN
ncbi:HMA2 domain-containing protein [Antarctobacter jejuensis]|uniref:HMA2 domain-containing protein n=1 Tax=Antarctobacter jejuensis TaxID=1439938 RepID=UPI003FD3A520